MDNRNKIIVIFVTLLAYLCLAQPVSSGVQFIFNSYQYATGGSSCPDFYQDTNVLFSWDGDHDSGTNYACDANGTATQGTNTNLTISTTYGEGGSNGALVDTADENLAWTNTGDDPIDDDATRTICVRGYIQTMPTTGETTFFEASDGSTNDAIEIQLRDDYDNMRGYYYADPNEDQAHGTSPTHNDWVTMCYSWDKPNNDHAAYPGNPEDEDSYDASEWEEDADEITTTMTDNLTSFMIGESLLGVATNGDVRIDRLVIMTGYKTAPPTNW